MTKSKLGEERAYLAYTSRSQFIAEGGSEQEIKQETGGQRDWRRVLGEMMFAGLLLKVRYLLIPPRTTCPEVASLTVCWGLPYQSSIKRMLLLRHLTGWSTGRFLKWGSLFSDDLNLCQADKNLTSSLEQETEQTGSRAGLLNLKDPAPVTHFPQWGCPLCRFSSPSQTAVPAGPQILKHTSLWGPFCIQTTTSENSKSIAIIQLWHPNQPSLANPGPHPAPLLASLSWECWGCPPVPSRGIPIHWERPKT